ncbi:MAG: hypothetical protein LBU48_05600 [Coriobacteriales bacterium]|nr:hypothetical protein [Coriobacteriales bacterium]
MKNDFSVLLDRASRFGDMGMLDDYGSYDERALFKFCALPVIEREAIEKAERAAQKRKAETRTVAA